MDHSEGQKRGATSGTGAVSLGPYVLIAPIAVGEATSVQLAQKHGALGFHRMAAIKRLNPALATQPEWTQLLLDEARLSAGVHHANVVDIIDVGTDDGAYLVMEYIEGADIATLLQRAGRERHARYVLPPIVDALNGLHALHTAKDALGESLSMVHQAPAARHILIGIDGTARITDLSQVAARGLIPSTLRRQRLRPGHMAPEQLLTPDQIDARTDVFIMGITLWEALTGERLFESEQPELSRRAVLERHVPRPSEVGLRPPRCFDAICLRALARKPEQRFASAAEMARELRDLALNQALYANSGELGQWVRALVSTSLLERRRAIGADAPSIEIPLDGREARTAASVPVQPPGQSTVRPTRAIAIKGTESGPSTGVHVGSSVPSGPRSRHEPAAAPPAGVAAPLATEPSRVARAMTVPVAAPPTRRPPASSTTPAMTLLGVSPRDVAPTRAPFGGAAAGRPPPGAASTHQVAPDRRAGATMPEQSVTDTGSFDWSMRSQAPAPQPDFAGAAFGGAPLGVGHAAAAGGRRAPPREVSVDPQQDSMQRRVRAIQYDQPSDAGMRGNRGAHLHSTDWGDEPAPSGRGLGILSVVLVGIIVVAGVVGFRQWSASGDPVAATPAAEVAAPAAHEPLEALEADRPKAAGEPSVTSTVGAAAGGGADDPAAQADEVQPQPGSEVTRPAASASAGATAATPQVRIDAGVVGARPEPPWKRAAPAPVAPRPQPTAPQRVSLPRASGKSPAAAGAALPPRAASADEPPGLPKNPYE